MKKYSLILGDILALLLTTLIGFAAHGELGGAFIARMAAAFFPLSIAWFFLTPWFGLFQQEITSSPRELWRPAFAMIFAAPLAAVLRGLILNMAIIPVFAVVLGASSALGITMWRALYFLLNRRTR